MAVEGEEEEEEDGNMQRHRKSLGTDISFGEVEWIGKYIEIYREENLFELITLF